nr:16S rRNA (uracil(1498)-N(3))-methyltransferase [Olivibacter sitiensis]
MHLFYTPQIDLDSKRYVLNEEESRHATRVLRLSAGDEIHLIDGKGNLIRSRIALVHNKHTEVELLQVTPAYGKRNHRLHIAIAPTKNIDRLEWFLEKATEIGIDEITPILCDHSERKEVKLERLDKVITAAMKQSMTAYHPLLNETVKIKDFLAQHEGSELFIAHCAEGSKSTLSKLLVPGQAATILIGPEGDFSAAEIDLALKSGAQAIHLGPTRLRTETAALYACMEVNLLNRG